MLGETQLDKQRAFLIFGKVSVFTGYFVIALGIAYSSVLVNSLQTSQSALVCTSTDCTSTYTDPISGVIGDTTDVINEYDAAAPIEPIATPVNVVFYNVPTTAVIDRDIEITIQVEGAYQPRLQLISPTHNTAETIEGVKNTNSKFTYVLPTSELENGEYYARVVVLSTDTETKSVFLSKHFTVKNTISDSSANDEEVVATTDENGALTPKVSTTIASTSVLLEAEESIRAEVVVEQVKATGTYKVYIRSKNVFDRAELYLQNTASTQKTFLGLATRVIGGYIYWFDAKSTPAGVYTILLEAKTSSGGFLQEQSDEFTVTRPVFVAALPTKEVLEVTREVAEDKDEDVNDVVDYVAIRKDYTSTISPVIALATPTKTLISTTTKLASSVDVPEDLSRVEDILRNNKEELNDLFLKHASAIQSGDKTLERLSDETLRKRLKEISAKADVDTKTQATIEKIANQQIEKVKEKIVVTENILKSRTDNKISKDADLDGISDYDEVTIYSTDPKNPDTDEDGVLDGVEIMRGFDPLNSQAETVIEYASPKNVGYTNESLLKVESVKPVVVTSETEGATTTVHSEIRGVALPNSFVTLYIFSTPTVVTLKTNSDGSFAYVFEKELEDGEHEVYVALTDNTGDIVVKSSGFSFVKTAQAFTYEDEAGSAPIVQSSSSQEIGSELSKTFILVAAMSLVALGFVLVLLGKVLRGRRTEDEFEL